MAKRYLIIITVFLLAIALLSTAACTSSKSIRATRVNAEIVDNSISVPVSEIQKNVISNLSISTIRGNISFMAYELGGEIYARADICPPCRSDRFSLKGDTLVCDTCATVFDAKTGEGLSGACVRYPKASVQYQVSDGKIIMKGDDLVKAYQDTLEPG